MSDRQAPPLAKNARFGQWRSVRNPRRAIYGTIVTAAILAGEGAAHLDPQDMIVSVLVTLLVYWIAHVYSEVLGHWVTPSSAQHRPAILSRLGQALAEEWAIVVGGLGVVLVLAVAWLAGASGQAAVNAALWMATAELLEWGIVAAKNAGLSGIRIVVSGVTSASFGAVIVLLKVVLH